VRELVLALADAGHSADVIGARWTLPDAPLRLRKIGERPGRLPGSYLALRSGGYDVAHAFTPQDAVAAVLWSRLVRAPAVFTACEPLGRATLADRRLRLTLLRLALERSAAVLAPDADVAESLRRWMAVAPRVIPPGSAADHVALYAQLLRS
jgi:hypothetical protein